MKTNNRNPRIGLTITYLILALAVLDAVGFVRYHQHINHWLIDAFQYDYFNSSFRRSMGKGSGEVPTDTLKIDMTPLEFMRLSSEWNAHYNNKQRIDNQPWLEGKESYKSRIKWASGVGSKWLRAKVSMMGMNRDHHPSLDRLSLKVKLKGERRLWGKKSFRLLLPETRGYFLDDLANRVYHNLFNGIQIRYKPVAVKFRKNPPISMLWEEKLDKFLIESNNRRESYLFETGYRGPLKSIPGIEELNISHTVNSGMSDTFRNANFEKSILNKFQIGGNELFQLIDADKYIGALAIGVVFGSWHHLIDINQHWYYNPVNHTLEPTIREVGMYTPLYEQSDINDLNSREVLKPVLPNPDHFSSQYVEWLLSTDSIFEQKLKTQIIHITRSVSKLIQEYEEPHLELEARQLKEYRSLYSRLNHRIQYFKKLNSITQKREIGHTNIHWEGNKTIQDELIIASDQTLSIAAGSRVVFSGKGCLKINGKIEVHGSESNPVVFKSSKGSEGAIFIESQDSQRFEYTKFENLKNWKRGFWETPASINVHRTTHVDFIRCIFDLNRSGDDYVNIFDCPSFLFKGCTFKNIKSDALDSDFSNGLVEGCTFVDVGNDGIDGSGSRIEIKNCHFVRIGDKAISAGERSRFKAESCQINEAAIGLVSKDESTLECEDITTRKLDLHIAVFQKKPEFGPSDFSSDRSLTGLNYLIEKGSNIGVKGGRVDYSKNVREKLYGADYGKATVK